MGVTKMDEKEKTYLMALAQIPGFDQVYIKALAEEFSSFADAWKYGREWKNALPISKDRLEFILHGKEMVDPEKIYVYSQKINVKICTVEDQDYPAALREVNRNPYFFYYFGTLPRREEFLFTIVGMRQCSRYGRDVAEKIAGDLVRAAKMTIVSGMALGIDAAAHLGALKAGGRTIAVLPSGIDEIYPAENRGLYTEIKEQGCLLTEYPFHFTPIRSTFPYRNRLMSGLGRGVLIVEGRNNSGAMHTVNHGLEQGKDIFAIPGSIFVSNSEAPHQSIKLGAKLVTGADDILLEYFDLDQVKAWLAESSSVAPDFDAFSPVGKKIWASLREGPLYFDEIQYLSEMEPAALATLLTEWELEGYVDSLPGKVYSIANTIKEVNNE